MACSPCCYPEVSFYIVGGACPIVVLFALSGNVERSSVRLVTPASHVSKASVVYLTELLFPNYIVWFRRWYTIISL